MDIELNIFYQVTYIFNTCIKKCEMQYTQLDVTQCGWMEYKMQGIYRSMIINDKLKSIDFRWPFASYRHRNKDKQIAI